MSRLRLAIGRWELLTIGVLVLLGTGYVFSFSLFTLKSSSMILSIRGLAVERGQPVPISTPIMAVGEQWCRPCFLDGWDVPEPMHRWSRKERAVIIVKMEVANAPPMLTLVLDMGGAINRGARKRDVEVFVNGRNVGQIELEPEGNATFFSGKPHEHRLTLPSASLGPSGVARIEFVTRPLHNPMQEYGTGDGRSLGVALRSLRFEVGPI